MFWYNLYKRDKGKTTKEETRPNPNLNSLNIWEFAKLYNSAAGTETLLLSVRLHVFQDLVNSVEISESCSQRSASK